MSRAVIYIHGKGGSPEEAVHYKSLFPEAEVYGFDYHSETPWEAEEEFPAYFDRISEDHDDVILIAVSIGCYFTMHALSRKPIAKVYMISPIVDMEELIQYMLTWSNVSEAELQEKKKIQSNFGEVLDWDYLCYVREHPVDWALPTSILCGRRDHLLKYHTITRFSRTHNASLTVMPDGEHWFHTKEQMAYLDQWLKGRLQRDFGDGSLSVR